MKHIMKGELHRNDKLNKAVMEQGFIYCEVPK